MKRTTGTSAILAGLIAASACSPGDPSPTMGTAANAGSYATGLPTQPGASAASGAASTPRAGGPSASNAGSPVTSGPSTPVVGAGVAGIAASVTPAGGASGALAAVAGRAAGGTAAGPGAAAGGGAIARPEGNGAAGGAAPTAPPGEPKIPEVAGECPTFRNGTVSFMGLGGIQIVAGTKASSPTAPMVFYWHGTGSFSGEFATSAAAVQRGVVEEGGVLVSFQGSTGGDLLSGTSVFGKGDFALTDQLVACAVKNHNVDPHRIFTTGCSAGGLFAAAMAALRSSYIAAAAPNSGGWVTPLMFQDQHTPPLMTVHGAPGADVVIIDFSESSATADKAFKARGGFVINCNHGGGHCGGAGQAPSMWEFFKAHPFGVTPEPWTALPSGFSSVCKIF